MTSSSTVNIDKKTNLLLNISTVWQATVAVSSVILIFLIAQGSILTTSDTWLKVVIGAFLLAALAAGTAGAWFLNKRNLLGRTIALFLNYLGFLVCLLSSMHYLGIFIGIDNLAANFGKGLLPLLGLALGYLVSASGDWFHAKIELEEKLKTAGKWIAIVSFIIFLFSVGLINALIAIGTELSTPRNLAFVISTILFGFMIWALWREPSAKALKANNAHSEMLDGYLFLSPNLLGFLFFFAGPLLFSLFISMTNWDGFGNKNWVGLQNYASIFNLDIKQLASPNQVVTEVLDTKIFDELTRFGLFGKNFIVGAENTLFWIALRNTLVFCLLAVPLSIIPALVLSNILNSKIPGMKIFRAIYFLPSVAATVGVSLIWQWLYNASIGFINYFITIGVNFINTLFNMVILDPQIRWLSDTKTALLAIIIMAAWQTMGFNTVLFLAGLQNIPKELYEAAIVDGAGPWAKFMKITLPLLAPTTFFVVTTTTIQALQAFEQVFILTNPPGGPNNSTLTVVLYLYQNGFQSFRQGYGAAVAWVLFLLIFAVTLFQFRAQRNTGAYDV